MKKSFIFCIIFTGLFFRLAWAEPVLKAEVDKLKISTDESLTYKLTVSAQEKNMPQPALPNMEGFRIISSAQSSTISFSEGKVKAVSSYIVILAPKDAGKFKIGPATIKAGNKVYSSNEFEIEVTQGKARPKPFEKPNSPGMPPPGSEEPQVTL